MGQEDKERNPLIVNLYGGPGSGKSTMASRIFSELKERGHNAELLTEYAKDKTWEQSFNVLNNQLYIFAKQHHRLWRVSNKVDIIVTDSPLLLSLVYGEMSDTFKKLVQEEVDRYESLDIFLQRVKPYCTAGRSQTEDEAKELDIKIKDAVTRAGYTFDLVTPGSKESVNGILSIIESKLLKTQS